MARGAAPLAGRRGGPQQIPRPELARLGPGAPWSQAGAVAPSVVTIADVRSAVAVGGSPGGTSSGGGASDGGAPGWVPQVHLTLPAELPSPSIRPAAVLCAVFDEGGQAQVILTRRSARLRSHTGEVSFPGGRLDPGESPVAAALRETQEEVGIDPKSVEVIGRLSTLSTRRNPSAITPFVGILPARPVLRPNLAEVDRAFTVPVAELYQGDVYHEELWGSPDGTEWPVSFFDVIGDTVWGATGRVLRELLDLIWGAAPTASGSTERPSTLGLP
jgi:8-oxo-dGTP pyrophosphatase MutT (NUDIX family)